LIRGVSGELGHKFNGIKEIDYLYRAASSAAKKSNFVSP
jgi:hypothetical protein